MAWTQVMPRLLLLVISLAAQCATRPDPAQLLWLPTNASQEPDLARPIRLEAGRSVYVDGSAAVSFSLSAPDHEEVTNQPVEHFEGTGWNQRSIQYLNPGLATSFSDGWQDQCACISVDTVGPRIQRQTVYTWMGEWEDKHGNVITYSFLAEGDEIRGHAAYIPAKIVKGTRR